MQVVTDFFDEMKSRSKGYASMEYQITGYRENKLVRLDVKVNQEVRTGPPMPALSLPYPRRHRDTSLMPYCGLPLAMMTSSFLLGTGGCREQQF